MRIILSILFFSVGYLQECNDGFTLILDIPESVAIEDGSNCFYNSDLDVLQQLIDNSQVEGIPQPSISSPIEFGLQEWEDGRLIGICSSNFVESECYVGYQLSGEIPDNIDNLESLTFLHLEGNNLSGLIPSNICNLINLNSINLESNGLTGELPDCFWNMMSLTDIGVGYNQLLGEIPASISNLINLTFLSLRENQFTGEIPSAIGNLMNLIILLLDRNQFTGEIPGSIVDLIKLESLHLGHNEFSGVIPEGIGNLTNLIDLGLDGNHLSGGIPDGIGNLINLNELYIDSNQLEGEIPSGMWSLTNLTKLTLGGNDLSGGLPSEIGNLTNLMQLGLWDCNLTGVIPESIGNLTKLEYLGILNNQLEGEIPSTIGNLINLIELDLSNNQLIGSIPSSIGNLTNLEELYFSFNEMSGEIPESIWNLINIKHLYLGRNNFSGHISNSIGSLESLVGLWLGGNNFSGKLPDELWELSSLTGLWVESNNFVGIIPASISNLTQLGELYLKNNQFSGIIPQEICSLPVINYLDLSYQWEGELWDYFNIDSNQFCPPFPVCIEEYVGEQNTSECINYGPVITNIIDIPEDQGGNVYLYFTKSPLDTTMYGAGIEMYSIERFDVNYTEGWVNIISGSAYNQAQYIYQVTTLIDSSSIRNGMTTFRVIANMNAGVFISEPDSGYSVDNIAPATPSSFTGIYDEIENKVFLSWEQSDENDLSHYNIYRNAEMYNTTNETSYIDQITENTEYAISAVDIHENESVMSKSVQILILNVIDNLIPTEYALMSAYPNPFNPTTTISFSIPEFGLTTITAYDITGRELETLTNAVLSIGNYSINWNASSYPSGVYLIRMGSGKFTKTQKVVLVK